MFKKYDDYNDLYEKLINNNIMNEKSRSFGLTKK